MKSDIFQDNTCRKMVAFINKNSEIDIVDDPCNFFMQLVSYNEMQTL